MMTQHQNRPRYELEELDPASQIAAYQECHRIGCSCIPHVHPEVVGMVIDEEGPGAIIGLKLCHDIDCYSLRRN